MNPHETHPCNFKAPILSIWKNRRLILQMTQREVVGRYKGSSMGLAWSFLHPAILLMVYTFVFSVVFKSRWGGSESQSQTEFAILLFTGMIVHGLFADVINRSHAVITSNTNFVKRVIFPLEILPVITLGAALFHSVISVAVLLVGYLLFNGFWHWTIVFLPIVFLPLIIVSLGAAWFLASLGVFLRDVGQTVGIIAMVLMFLSPIFYPISAVPPIFQKWLMLNPLTFIIEQARNVIYWGLMPEWTGLGMYTAVASIIAWAGFVWFQKTRKGFADVL